VFFTNNIFIQVFEMPRVKKSCRSRRRRKKILKLAKGFRGPRSKLFRIAKESVDRALNFAYRDRRVRKRDFRRLWITRISAAASSNDINYSQFMLGLKRANVSIDRKILSDMAISDPNSFAHLALIAKENVG
jgi:large subunit ribosomal protein L20